VKFGDLPPTIRPAGIHTCQKGQPYIESKFTSTSTLNQTGEGVNGTLPTALKDFYGKINFDAVRSIVNYHHQTSDLHAALYDFSSNKMRQWVKSIEVRRLFYPLEFYIYKLHFIIIIH